MKIAKRGQSHPHRLGGEVLHRADERFTLVERKGVSHEKRRRTLFNEAGARPTANSRAGFFGADCFGSRDFDCEFNYRRMGIGRLKNSEKTGSDLRFGECFDCWIGNNYYLAKAQRNQDRPDILFSPEGVPPCNVSSRRDRGSCGRNVSIADAGNLPFLSIVYSHDVEEIALNSATDSDFSLGEFIIDLK